MKLIFVWYSEISTSSNSLEFSERGLVTIPNFITARNNKNSNDTDTPIKVSYHNLEEEIWKLINNNPLSIDDTNKIIFGMIKDEYRSTIETTLKPYVFPKKNANSINNSDSDTD